jgi:type II secretory pathway pseudopilin PulG
MHASRAAQSRAGFSLLEVLVACGLLVIGLTSLAALLPAAASRLAEAHAEDQAGTLAADAWADIVNRGLASSDLFLTGSTGAARTFGPVFSSLSGPTIALADNGAASRRIDGSRSFRLEDDLTYRPLADGNAPLNMFSEAGLGPRDHREGICWAAMITPRSFAAPVLPGSAATVSLAVFKKAGDIQPFTLTYASGNYALSPGDESTRKTFARGCSYLLLTPSGTSPTWRRINASWTTNGGSFVTFTDPDGLPTSGTISGFGFQGLLRLDERAVVLD